jgi:hypothetical protein
MTNTETIDNILAYIDSVHRQTNDDDYDINFTDFKRKGIEARMWLLKLNANMDSSNDIVSNKDYFNIIKNYMSYINNGTYNINDNIYNVWKQISFDMDLLLNDTTAAVNTYYNQNIKEKRKIKISDLLDIDNDNDFLDQKLLMDYQGFHKSMTEFSMYFANLAGSKVDRTTLR